MSTFSEVFNDFTMLYGQGNYSQALELISAELPHQADYAAVPLCFQAAMQSRIGDTDGALHRSGRQTSLMR